MMPLKVPVPIVFTIILAIQFAAADEDCHSALPEEYRRSSVYKGCPGQPKLLCNGLASRNRPRAQIRPLLYSVDLSFRSMPKKNDYIVDFVENPANMEIKFETRRRTKELMLRVNENMLEFPMPIVVLGPRERRICVESFRFYKTSSSDRYREYVKLTLKESLERGVKYTLDIGMFNTFFTNWAPMATEDAIRHSVRPQGVVSWITDRDHAVTLFPHFDLPNRPTSYQLCIEHHPVYEAVLSNTEIRSNQRSTLYVNSCFKPTPPIDIEQLGFVVLRDHFMWTSSDRKFRCFGPNRLACFRILRMANIFTVMKARSRRRRGKQSRRASLKLRNNRNMISIVCVELGMKDTGKNLMSDLIIINLSEGSDKVQSQLAKAVFDRSEL